MSSRAPLADGRVRYDKVHLVPYGEYVPLRSLFPFINKLVAGVGNFNRGKGYYPLNIVDYRLGVLICYERNSSGGREGV